MGCGEQLIQGEGHQVWCCHSACPRPTAAAEILADPETGHIVTFTDDGFTIRHPLRERLDDALMTCPLHAGLMDGTLDAGEWLEPGQYRAVQKGPGWAFALAEARP